MKSPNVWSIYLQCAMYVEEEVENSDHQGTPKVTILSVCLFLSHCGLVVMYWLLASLACAVVSLCGLLAVSLE